MEENFEKKVETNVEKTFEEKLMDEYVGGDYKKFSSNANWISAVVGQMVGPVWFFYRKAPLLGFLFMFITYIVGSIATAIELEEASWIMFLIYLVATNKLYTWHVKNKVNKIMNDVNLTEDEMLEVARKKGGKSKLAAIIYALLFIGYVALMMYVMVALMTM